MAFNSNLPADTTAPAEIRENFRALKEDKIVDAATAVTADSAVKLSTPRTIALQGDATGSAIFDGSADVAISVSVLSSGVPVGTIIAWPSSTLPGGDDAGKWLECNGQSTEGYPELAAIVGSSVPDYRGVFLRGLGNQSSTDSYGTINHQSAGLGILQGDAIRNITGAWSGSTYGIQTSTAYLSGAFGQKDTGTSTYVGGGAGAANTFDFNASRVVPTDIENRPVNKAVYYLIRAK